MGESVFTNTSCSGSKNLWIKKKIVYFDFSFKPPQQGHVSSTVTPSSVASPRHGESSFTSSFCSDLDAEMLCAMEKMESDFKSNKATPKSGKGKATPKHGRKTTESAKTKAQLIFNTPTQNNGKRLKGGNSGSPSVQNAEKRQCYSSGEKQTPLKQTVLNSGSAILKNGGKGSKNGSALSRCQEKENSNRKIENKVKVTPGSRIEKSKNLDSKDVVRNSDKRDNQNDKLDSRQSQVSDNMHNVSWSTPQIASTPQESPRVPRGRGQQTATKQTQLFKSLFTIPGVLNTSDLDRSLDLGERQGGEAKNKGENIKCSGSVVDENQSISNASYKKSELQKKQSINSNCYGSNNNVKGRGTEKDISTQEDGIQGKESKHRKYMYMYIISTCTFKISSIFVMFIK